MATCKWCNRSGFFLSVNSLGVCSNCNTVIVMDINQHARIATESIEIINKSKQIDTVLSRFQVAEEHLKLLLPYEQKGIPVLTEPPSALIKSLNRQKQRSISGKIKDEVTELLNKYKVTPTEKGKLNLLAKYLLKIQEYKRKINAYKELEDVENQIKALLHQTQLDIHLKEAEKAELKGSKKKALDSYYEALYFLQNDDIDDSLQTQNILEIEAKIRELSGKDVIDLSTTDQKSIQRLR